MIQIINIVLQKSSKPAGVRGQTYDSFLRNGAHLMDDADGLFTPLVSSKILPFLTSARALIDLGYDPSAKLVARWKGSDAVALTATLGIAAKWTVHEPDIGPMRIIRYVPNLYAKSQLPPPH